MTDRAHDRHLAPVLDEPPPDDYAPADWTPPLHNERQAPTDDRLPPQDLDAERCILGGMLLSASARDDVTNTISSRDLYQPAHELIFDTIARLHLDPDTPVDTITVADELEKQGDLKRAGGQAYLHQLIAAVPTAANAGYYAHIVLEKARLRRLVEAGTRIVQLGYSTGGGDVDDIVQAAESEVAAAVSYAPGGGTAGNTWAPVDLASILEHGEILEQPTQLARTDGQCLLYPAAIHSISGEPESGKTWVALIAAAQTLRNTDEHVTYVDFEDRAGRVIPRLVNLGAPRAAILDRFHYIRPSQALDPTGRKILDEHAGASSLSIIDGVTEAMTMHGLSLLDNEDAARYLDLLPRHLADHGPAVLQIDHVVKDSEKQGRWAIGAGHKLAGLDGAAYGIKVLEPFGKGRIGRAAIAVHKDRPGSIREFALGNAVAHLVIDSRGDTMAAYLEEPTSMPKSADGAMRPTHLMEMVSRFIEITPGASRKQIEDGVQGKRDYIRMAIDALVREGFLTTTAGPRGTHNHSIIATFREDEDDAR